MGTIEVSIFQVNEIGMTFDVSFRGETFPAKFTIVLDVGVNRLDVLGQSEVVREVFLAKAALMPIQFQVNGSFVLVQCFHPFKTFSANVAINLDRHRVDSENVTFQELHSSKRFATLGTRKAL